MATIDIKLKSHDELIFEIAKLNTDIYLLKQENKQLKEEIKKYINSNDFVYDELYKKREKIKKILGGKENE